MSLKNIIIKMNAAIKKLEGYDNIIVWVLKGNETAIHFYERYGFLFDGSQKEIKLGTSVDGMESKSLNNKRFRLRLYNRMDILLYIRRINCNCTVRR